MRQWGSRSGENAVSLPFAQSPTRRGSLCLLAQAQGTPDAPLPPALLPLDALKPATPLIRVLADLIHVPGLRGNPARSYPRAEIGEGLHGAFEPT
jgi:hypothetical protein